MVAKRQIDLAIVTTLFLMQLFAPCDLCAATRPNVFGIELVSSEYGSIPRRLSPSTDDEAIYLMSDRCVDEQFDADSEMDASEGCQEKRVPWIYVSDVFPLFTGDPSLACVDPISDHSVNHGLLFTVDYDAFRGIPDGGWENNGIRAGFNFASKLGSFSDLTGIGVQIGSSVGIYDWGGTDYRMQNQDMVETQGFLTYGFYRKPTETSPITGGVVQDWMFNDNFGVFGKCPTLSQLRAQLGYAVSASNEFGVWGTAHVVSSTLNVDYFGPTKWQSVNHLSGYWHHKWYEAGPDTWLSVGVPSYDRLAGGGSLGDYLVTASAMCPLSDVVSVFSSVTYLHQSGRLGGTNAADEAWNFTVGLALYPWRNARTTTVAGQRWMPLMPVANNGSFLVDTSQHY